MKSKRSDSGLKKPRDQSCVYCKKTGLANAKIHQKSCKHPDNPHFNSSYYKAHTEARLGKPGRKWTDEQKAAHRISMQRAVQENPDSYRGRFFRGYNPFVHDGVSYDSEWEFKLKQYFDSVGITYIRSTPGFSYKHKGVPRTYFPDFYLPKLKVYVEVKGLATTRDLSKWRAFKGKLIIVTGEIIRHIQNGGGFDFKSAALHDSQFVVGNVPYSKRGLLKLKVSQFDGLSLRPKKTDQEKFEARSRAQQKRWSTPEAIALREAAAVRKREEARKYLDPRYSGERSSQYGSFWITNGTISKKWRASKGKIPRGYVRGRTM